MADKWTAYSRILAHEEALCRRNGVSRMERYARSAAFYNGENLPPDNVEQPLGINYIQAIHQQHAHYLWGEWDHDIVQFSVDHPSQEKADQIREFCYRFLRQNDGNSLLYSGGLDGSIYGDSVYRVYWDPLDERCVLELVPPDYAHFAWHPTNPNVIQEVIISYPIPRTQAYDLYQTEGNRAWAYDNVTKVALSGNAMYWEHWTPYKRSTWIDDVQVQEGPNPYVAIDRLGNLLPGAVPFVHVANLRAGGEFYGFSDCEYAYLIQDEINERLADEGDIINNFAHPIIVVNGWAGDVGELPVGPDTVWDLGREGKATILQWNGSSPTTRDYNENVREILFETSAMSPVAFGRHKGTQPSASSLAIQMMPVTTRARWKRMLWGEGIRRLVKTAALIEERMHGLSISQKDFSEATIKVSFAPILPRDRMALINENVALMAAKARSLPRLLRDLQEERVEEEEQAIYDTLKKLAQLGAKSEATGSPSVPEGPNRRTLGQND